MHPLSAALCEVVSQGLRCVSALDYHQCIRSGLLQKVLGLKRENSSVSNFTLYPELVPYGSVSLMKIAAFC